YDGLVKTMGGPSVPGVGWAAGIERLAMLLTDPPPPPRPVAVVPVGAGAERLARQLAERLRGAGLMVELGYRGNLSKRLKRANKLNARIAVILGEDEIARGVATLRDLDSGDQSEAPLDTLEARLAEPA
ncbi:MAG: His/Gly/Thr/Pro-type tRNA ligase C-terminal domain-containing protein, partial [Alphaproteobacteria bacterium]